MWAAHSQTRVQSYLYVQFNMTGCCVWKRQLLYIIKYIKIKLYFLFIASFNCFFSLLLLLPYHHLPLLVRLLFPPPPPPFLSLWTPNIKRYISRFVADLFRLHSLWSFHPFIIPSFARSLRHGVHILPLRFLLE